MPLKLIYITNNLEVARVAESCGIDRIFVDLEINNKEERQKGLNSVISKHSIQDISKIKSVINKSELLVRINSICDNTEYEIEEVISRGADIIMLPFFELDEEVMRFSEAVNGRVKTMILIETRKAVENIDKILAVKGIDEYYIGLNDLHLSYGMKFMFEPLAEGKVDYIAEKIKKTGKPFGFGGVARIGNGLLPAEYIIGEHYRLGSSSVILSRSFCNIQKERDVEVIQNIFAKGIKEIRDTERFFENCSKKFLSINRQETIKKINVILDKYY